MTAASLPISAAISSLPIDTPATTTTATIRTTTTTNDGATTRERLSLGYFEGRTIFRNALHPSAEQLTQGFVTLEELVPPDCQRILATTFCAPKAFEWLDQTILGGPYGKYARPSHVLLIHHADDDESVQPALMMKQIKVRRKKQENWYKLAYRPHTGGCMHPKVLLFRTTQGLRVVVSGNNFYQYQWENDRDCMWVQDFFASANTNSKSKSKSKSSDAWRNKEENHGMPLRSFLTDLCQAAVGDQAFIKEHLEKLFANIDLSQSKASLVYSFPRCSSSSSSSRSVKLQQQKDTTGDRGGWKQLTQVVQDCLLDEYDTENDYNSPNTPDRASAGTTRDKKKKDHYILYAMSGSIGDLDPTLLKSMKNAMSGKDTFFDDFPTMNDKKGMAQEWAKLSGIQCLLPSLETSQKMDPTWNGRLMSQSHWRSIPRLAQQSLFSDAIPNPNFERTQQRPKYPFSHAKVLYCKYSKSTTIRNNKPSVLYVGSHNFSKAAWGLANRMPANVEVGVVLSTKDPILQQEWESRLPYRLSSSFSTDGNTSSSNYRPLLSGDWKGLSEKPNQMTGRGGDS